ncbi:MAG: hypothetical protein KA313_05330, partial [Pseudarcicella sp.]|nr:hypothetical protein [Pseudarcicella sp.]
MKNKIFNIGLLFIIFFYSSSCEDVLEKPMDNALNDEMMFTGNFTNSDLNKGTFIESFLNEAYDRIPSTFGAYSLGATLDIATDNAFSKYSNNETNVI